MTCPPGTYLAFDFGERRLGVAVGQSLTGSARPLETLDCRQGIPWERLRALLDQWAPAGLVVGLPLHADGSPSAMSEAAERFARRLHGRYHLPVHHVAELLSSVEAEARLRESGGHKAGLDAVAAQVILETWFAEAAHGAS
ncbi:Holliday junction resolvase RuvX [Alkalilimnicola sp. S0819]|uniref:Holliday junction resolvase RuvX n=1 Tax=Alkalilimnicola sp. S0819 TaxID=2613922 RepID=UPI001261AE71|nr:Holliday junction resolvase RuvX [Alkalilimnicola sp. S0819]KAB7624463.1 Holliday junction resolvase RuvX [Alkalilimnicola sp. S0819]MPQ16298.1 Holliday junction resolvase RuvX [Alkalilimnicola sp. S0819]